MSGQTQRAETAAASSKGPLVWLDMDQTALDDAYDQLKWASNRDQANARREAASADVWRRLGPPKRLSYGAKPIEGIDLFTTSKPNAPVAIYIHGGGWRLGNAKGFAFQAETFVNAGVHFALLDFDSVDDTKGDLMALARQVRTATAWIAKNAATFGGDPDKVYLCGHSSGAHLGGVVLVTDWQKDFGLPADTLKGVVLCSGMYELEPVRRSKRSGYVNFTDEVVDALSAQRHLARITCPVTLIVGTEESPEFQRQTREFAAALKAAGKPVELIIGTGYNHFEMAETFANPYGHCGRAALKLIGS
jgi:arylformamidase